MGRHHRNPIGDKSGCMSISMSSLIGTVLLHMLGNMFRSGKASGPSGCDGPGRHRGGRSWGDSSGQGC